MAIPNLKNCEFSIPMTEQHPVGANNSNIGHGINGQSAGYSDLLVPWGHVWEVQLLRVTNEHESSTYDIDVILSTGKWKTNNNYYSSHSSFGGNWSSSNAINTTTPYVNMTETQHADMAHWLCHEEEVVPDNYVDIIKKDTPLYLSEGNTLRFDTTTDYNQSDGGYGTKTLVVTISYIDHYN